MAGFNAGIQDGSCYSNETERNLGSVEPRQAKKQQAERQFVMQP